MLEIYEGKILAYNQDKLFKLTIIYPDNIGASDSRDYPLDKLLNITNLPIEYFDFTFVNMTVNLLHAKIEISRIN